MKSVWTAVAHPRIVNAVREQKLTYLDRRALHDLHVAARTCSERHPSALMIETGCALGGSAIVIASAKQRATPLRIYDVFGMIPPPGEQDDADVHARYATIRSGDATGIAGDAYYGYEEDLVGKVVANFSRNGVDIDAHHVTLVKGLFEDTLDVEEPVSLAHLDGDWYDSVMVCLKRISPLMLPGGRFVIDDYDAWSGCRKAVDDFLLTTSSFKVERHARVHLVKREA
jgi:asparagine synthase (glutamine-hydrolysing)